MAVAFWYADRILLLFDTPTMVDVLSRRPAGIRGKRYVAAVRAPELNSKEIH